MRAKVQSVILGVGIASVFAATGCNLLAKLRRSPDKADAGASATLAAPPAPQIREGGISFRETKANVSAAFRGSTYEISFFDFPPSSKVTVGAATLTTSAEGYAQAKVDLAERISRLSPKEAFDSKFKLDTQTKLGLDFGPQAKLSVDLAPEAITFPLTELFRKVPATPVVLGTAPKAGQHTAILLGVVTPEVLGAGKTVADIDWVAKVEREPVRNGKTCTGYRKSGEPESAERSFVVQLIDEKVSIYETRTGKTVVQKVFQAPNVCKSVAVGGDLKSYVPTDDERAWIRQQIASRR